MTEDLCGPELERTGGLQRGVDFVLGYSPERINPGDREHTVDRITKVISGEDAETLDRVDAIYSAVTSGGTFRAASIKAAEAAKVIENAQRDINIAFVNEITQIFAQLDLSVWDVLAAARTKWNFLDFKPGLVGGHCIGVDPYYLAHVATEHDIEPRVILSGRAINDGMGAWVAETLHDKRGGMAGSALVMGLTFKENVPDIRNSKVIDVVTRLRRLGHDVTLHDPLADPAEFSHEYGASLDSEALSRRYDLVIARGRASRICGNGRSGDRSVAQSRGAGRGPQEHLGRSASSPTAGACDPPHPRHLRHAARGDQVDPGGTRAAGERAGDGSDAGDRAARYAARSGSELARTATRTCSST